MAAVGAPIVRIMSRDKPGKGDKLLAQYTLHEVLGQGAFGVVYRCVNNASGKEYAVKMIDQVESRMPEIKREIEMLGNLAHPSVTKLVDVYFEKVFVCMVMCIYKGGDLMKGMAGHWGRAGMIGIDVVRKLLKQAWMAVAWMHQNKAVHRDIKGDNFMMSHPKVEDPENVLYLADFGTVREMQPGERLNFRCGTRHYWSPEFYKLDYGIKVDCWATGVITYGLFSGKFPFRNEKEVQSKALRFPSRIPQEGVDMISHVLARDENKRYEAKEALEHPFVKVNTNNEWNNLTKSADSSDTLVDDGWKLDMVEDGANGAVVQRRATLVARLQHAHLGKKRTLKRVFGVNFTAEDQVSGRSVQYEWWPVDKTDEMFSLFKTAPRSTEDSTAMDKDLVTKMLKNHDISLESFGQGKAKTLDEFASEIQKGKCRLLMDATQYKSLVRVSEIVLLKITIIVGGTKRYLYEISEEYPDGRRRNSIDQLPGDKRLPHENTRETTERLLRTRMKMENCDVSFNYEDTAWQETEDVSPSFPAVRTIYRKEVVTGVVNVLDPTILIGIGVTGTILQEFTVKDEEKYTRQYVWLSDTECDSRGVKQITPMQKDEISALVYPPVGLNERELNDYLVGSGVDLTHWGEGNYKSLREFSEELVKGEARLMTRSTDKKLVRVVEVVVLQISSKDGKQVLVEASEMADDQVVARNRLPAIKRLVDEHQFLAAHRLITQILKLPDNYVKIDIGDVRVVEELQASTSYYGLSTLYRKRFIKAVWAWGET